MFRDNLLLRLRQQDASHVSMGVPTQELHHDIASPFSPASSVAQHTLCAQVPEQVHKGYEKAQAAVALRKANEAAVAPGKEADSELLAAYMAYIKLEEAQGDPARVQVPLPSHVSLSCTQNACTQFSIIGTLLCTSIISQSRHVGAQQRPRRMPHWEDHEGPPVSAAA